MRGDASGKSPLLRGGPSSAKAPRAPGPPAGPANDGAGANRPGRPGAGPSPPGTPALTGAASPSYLHDESGLLDRDAAERAWESGRFTALEPGRPLNLGFAPGAVWLRLALTAPVRGDYALSLGMATLDLVELHERRRSRGEPAIDIGIGIHTGPLVLGTVGTGDRLSCTVIGDTVNVASRLEGLTKTHGERVLLSDATLRALAVPRTVRAVGTVRVRGKSEETTLHALGVDPARAA